MTTYIVNTGLSAGTVYYYRVRASNASGTSASSNVITLTTVPPDPVASSASSTGQTSFVANWGASTSATSYSLDVSTSSVFASFVTGYNNLSVGNVTTYAVNTNLSAGTVYYYRVRSSNASGTSSSSGTISLTTVPPDPVASAATAIVQTSFAANWATSLGATVYVLDVSTSNTFSTFVPGFNGLALGNVTSYPVGTSVSSGTVYYYRIRASNASGTSPTSNTITLTTTPPDPVATAATC